MITLPAIIEEPRMLKDKTVKISLAFQEQTPEVMAEVFRLCGSYGFVAIKEENFLPSELEAMDDLKADAIGKSPSQRLRAVLYLLWKQDDEGFRDFGSYYHWRVERVIDFYKSKLDE
jgi:hypothetical protein